MTKIKTTAELAAIIREVFPDFTPYERHYNSSAKHEAQRALSGRTHYADDATLRYFYCRILSCKSHADGLIFTIVESGARDHQNTRRGFRFRAFDVFGTVIGGENIDEMHTTSDKAAQARAEWLDSFDVVAHYAKTIGREADRTARQLSRIKAACKQLPKVAG